MRETYVIHVTKECNCNCTYCYETDKTSEYAWEEIETLLDNILQYAPDEFGIEFLGGEPMLRFDLIQKVVDYVPQAGWFGITTNGTIVTDELISLLRRDSRVQWSASIDGHSFANSLRKTKDGRNTYHTVIENFNKLVEAGVDTNQLAYHMTIHPYNVGYLTDSVLHLYEQGLLHGAAGIVESTMELDDSFFERYEQEMQQISDLIHSGEYEGLRIHELDQLKPTEDVRHYIKDDTGKTVAESYGRAPGDITDQEVEGLQAHAAGSEAANKINAVRKKVYDYHNRQDRYYGLGTGRCGTKTLAEFFKQKYNSYPVAHEPMPPIPWKFSEEQMARILDMESHVVSSSLINHAEQLIRQHDAKFVCIRRDREEFVNSFLRAHTLFPYQEWAEVQNREQFPEYPEGTTMRDGLRLYWEDYYTKAENLASKYEGRFQLIEFEDFINRDAIKNLRQSDGDYQPGLCACRKRETQEKDQGA